MSFTVYGFNECPVNEPNGIKSVKVLFRRSFAKILVLVTGCNYWGGCIFPEGVENPTKAVSNQFQWYETKS